MNNKTKNELISIILERDNIITDLNNTISDRDNKVSELNLNLDEHNKVIIELEEKIDGKIDENSSLNSELEEKKLIIESKNEEIKDLEIKLEEFEVKKFAQAFETEKDEYDEKLKFWTKISIWSFVFLLISTTVVTYISYDVGLEKKISLFFIDFIFLVFTIFSVKQYSYYSNHYSKSLEKQTLAQGYHNILKSGEDGEIKEEFKEKLVNILCADKKLENKNNLPIEQIFNTLENLSEK